MDVHEALYTTRAMRRVRPDPIPEAVQARILDAVIRAGEQQVHHAASIRRTVLAYQREPLGR
jgi:hypothetical protein